MSANDVIPEATHIDNNDTNEITGSLESSAGRQEQAFIRTEEFPAWMKQARRGVDWGAIIIIGFCLIASMSFITQAELPAYNNTEHYVYQIADYAEAFSEGIAYNRWSPYAISGYGAPIPYYYPSGTAYFGGSISYLFTNNALLATKILYIVSFVLAGSMTYHFVKLQGSALSGMLASIIYIFSPFVMITVPHIEGNLALSLGIALLPSFLWAVSRFLKRHQAFDFTLVAIIVGLIIFIIPSILLQGFVASAVLIIIDAQQGLKPKKIALFAGAILAGVLLTSFYWMPALLQRNAVDWYPALIEAPNYRLLWSDLFRPSQAIDSGLLNPLPTYNLGWGLLLVMPISFSALILKRNDRVLYLGFLGLGVAILGLVLLFAPHQTSWLVLISLALAISASYHGRAIFINKSFQLLIVMLSITLVLISSMPTWIIPKPELTISTATGIDQINYHQAGYGYAGLPVGLDLPSSFPPEQALLAPIDIADSRFQTNTQVTPLIDSSAYIGRYNISTDRAIELEYQRAYFPNWQILDNTGNLLVTESSRHLLSISIPANTDTSAIIRFSTTVTTAVAWIVSIGTVIICGFLWWYRWRTIEGDYDTSILLSGTATSLLLAILVIFTVLRVVAPSIPSNILAPATQYTMADSLFVQTNFNSNFQLFAYNNPTRTYQQGDIVQIRTFWSINSPTDSHYLVQLHLRDSDEDEILYESGYTHVGHFPTNRWQATSIVTQNFVFNIPVGQGEYFIAFDVYECKSACSIDIMDSNEPEGTIPVLRPIIVD